MTPLKKEHVILSYPGTVTENKKKEVIAKLFVSSDERLRMYNLAIIKIISYFLFSNAKSDTGV